MKNDKKTIGIIGGVGPQASDYLYQQIISQAQTGHGAKNNEDFPEVVLYSIPVPDFMADEDRLEEARVMFRRVLEGFEKVGVSRVVIGSNTVHMLLGQFERETKLKFISMIDGVVGKVVGDGRKVVGLLSSPMTIKQSLYSDKLTEKGISLIYPDESGQRKVEAMIRSVMSGEGGGELKSQYIEVAQSLFDQGAEAIILGCTELPLAINYEALGDRVYDSMKILAEKIVDYYYN